MITCSLYILAVFLIGDSKDVIPRSLEELASSRHCGTHCIYIALSSLDKAPETFSELAGTMENPSDRGFNLNQLGLTCERYGAVAKPVKCDASTLTSWLRAGAIPVAHFDEGHFVVVQHASVDAIEVIDNGMLRSVSVNEFESRYSGNSLMVSAEPVSPTTGMSFLAIVLLAVGFTGLAVGSFAMIRGRVHRSRRI